MAAAQLKKFEITVCEAGRRDISDGAPVESYFGYDYVDYSCGTAEFLLPNITAAKRLAASFRKTWKEQGHNVSYSVSAAQ